MLEVAKFSLFVIFLLFYHCGKVDAVEKNDCASRCSRLHTRSMERIGFTEERITVLFEKLKPLGTMKDVCWRQYDYLDCMKRCPKSREHEKYARNVRFKCKEALKDMEDKLQCITKFHSFIEVKCSSFLNEAVRFRAAHSPDTTPDRDTCRYLHLNSICLENAVNTFCPRAKNIFRRLNFRDYFLNFILPENDLEFDDDDLDSCQIYDFVRKAGNLNVEEAEDESEEGLTTLVNRWEDEETTTVMVDAMDRRSGKDKKHRKEFTNLLTDLLSTSTSAENLVTSTETALYSPSDAPLTRVTVTRGPATTESTVDTSTSDEADFFMETTTQQAEETQTTKRPKGKGRKGKKKQQESRKFHDPMISTSTESSETTEELTTYMTEPASNLVESATEQPELTTNLGTVVHIPVSVEEVTEPQTVTPNSADISTEIVTKKKKVFSDDSMEDIPPNFFHSSMRSSLFTSTMRYHLQDSDFVTPVSLDTSTLFGDEWAEPATDLSEQTQSALEMNRRLNLRPTGVTDSMELEYTESSVSTQSTTTVPPIRDQDPAETQKRLKEILTTVTSHEMDSVETVDGTTNEPRLRGKKKPRKDKKKKEEIRIVPIESRRSEEVTLSPRRYPEGAEESQQTPMIRAGKVVVKPIIDWNQADDKEEVRDVMHRSIPKESSDSAHFRDQDSTDFSGRGNAEDTGSPTGKNTFSEAQLLIFIYILLFGIALLVLLCTLIFCVWCRKNTDSYEINKY